MINRPIETFNEICRAKSVYHLAEFFEMDDETLNYIYDFIGESDDNKVVGKGNSLLFYVKKKLVKTVETKLYSIVDVKLVWATADDYGTVYKSYSTYLGSDSSDNNNNNNNNNN